MNANASIFIPFASRLMELISTPFFQQRLERFLFKEYRSDNGCMNDISILAQGAEAGTILPEKKKEVIFLGAYKGHVIVYEADRMTDPRTGHFRKLIQSP